MTYFVIMAEHRDPDDDIPLFWSNEEGWLPLEDASLFTKRERNALILPMGAWGWLQLPKIKYRQHRWLTRNTL